MKNNLTTKDVELPKQEAQDDGEEHQRCHSDNHDIYHQ